MPIFPCADNCSSRLAKGCRPYIAAHSQSFTLQVRNAQTAPKSVNAAQTGIMTKLDHRHDVCNSEYSTLGPMHPAPPVNVGPAHPETPGAQVSGRLITISKPPTTTKRPGNIMEMRIRIVLFRAQRRSVRKIETVAEMIPTTLQRVPRKGGGGRNPRRFVLQ